MVFLAYAALSWLFNALRPRLHSVSESFCSRLAAVLLCCQRPVLMCLYLSTYCPTKVDKQLGWVVRDPGFRPDLNNQPIK